METSDFTLSLEHGITADAMRALNAELFADRKPENEHLRACITSAIVTVEMEADRCWKNFCS